MKALSRVSACLFVAFVGCGGGSSPKSPEAPTDARNAERGKQPSRSKDLTRAREIRAALMQDPPPQYAGSGTKNDVLGFIRTDIKGWFERVQPKRREAEDLYWQEAQGASDPREASKIVGEMLAMNDDLHGRFLQAARAAIPEEWSRDETLSAVYGDASRRSTFGAVVKPGLEKCAAAEGKLRDELVAKCRKRIAELR